MKNITDKSLENLNSEDTLDFIQKSAGVKLLQELPPDLSNISYTFEDDIDTIALTFEDFLKKYSFINPSEFDTLKKENVGENSLLEIYKTYNFLVGKFDKSKNKLLSYGFNIDDFLEAIIRRLVNQVLEAGKSQRKLKNGIVVGLSKYSTSNYVFMKIPYYAFASTNVSLDVVKVKNGKDGKEYSLREIDDLFGSTNDEGGFFLPNSMGVSASLITTDKKGNMVFISQERNNATTLSQNSAKFIASASGAVDFKLFDFGGNLDLLHHAVGNEVVEELGLNPVKSKLTKEKIVDQTNLSVGGILGNNKHYDRVRVLGEVLNQEGFEILGRELGLDANLLPAALVMEDKRRNPEFIFLGKVGYSVEEIQNFWETAESKNESLSIRGITYPEILDDLEMRENKGIKMIDDHFYMSYIGFLIKTSGNPEVWKD